MTRAERIIQQIVHYRARITKAEQEFNRLVSLVRDGGLDAEGETRLKELDGFLERATQKQTAIPDLLKDTSLKKDLHRLIENTDRLLEKLNDK